MDYEKLKEELTSLGFNVENWPDIPTSRGTNPTEPQLLLQVKLLRIPPSFNDEIKFEVFTNLSLGERIKFELCDVDSIFSNKPDANSDTVLYSGHLTLRDRNVVSFKLNQDMQRAAYSDVEFSLAECYVRLYHVKVGNIYSEVFNVKKVEDFESLIKSKKESWGITEIERLSDCAYQGSRDDKRNCGSCCLNAFVANIKALYELSPNYQIPADGIMSDAVKALKSTWYRKLESIAPTFENKVLTTKSFDIPDQQEFLDEVKPNIQDKLASMVASEQICIFAVGIAAEYHSVLIVVSKNQNLRLPIGDNNTVYGTDFKPLFLFVESNGGLRGFINESNPDVNLDGKINEFLRGAYQYFNGKTKYANKYYPRPELDINLDAVVYQLFNPKNIR